MLTLWHMYLKKSTHLPETSALVKAAMERETCLIPLAYHFVYQTGFLRRCDLELGWD